MARLTPQQTARRAWERLGFGATAEERSAAPDPTTVLLARRSDDPGAAATPPPTLRPLPPGGRNDPQARRAAAEVDQANLKALSRWWLVRMATADDQLTERLTWFWHGHFATSAQKVRPNALMLVQNETLRRHATGDFRRLAHAMVADPALILWLDGQKNTAKAPNENLSRELMELFLLGIGHYTEDDVKEGARALTGWRVDVDTGTAAVDPRRADTRATTIFGHTGAHSADAFVDLCLDRPESAAFVVDRLWFRTMGPTPPPGATRARLLSAYAGGDVRALVTALARDEAFADDAYATVRSPVEWFVGTVRSAGVDLRAWDEKALDQVVAMLRQMGQAPFLPPSVGGWPAGRAWLSSATSVARVALATHIARTAGLARGRGGRDSADRWAAAFGTEWSPRTRAALASVGDRPADAFIVAACAPETIISR